MMRNNKERGMTWVDWIAEVQKDVAYPLTPGELDYCRLQYDHNCVPARAVMGLPGFPWTDTGAVRDERPPVVGRILANAESGNEEPLILRWPDAHAVAGYIRHLESLVAAPEASAGAGGADAPSGIKGP